MGGKRCGIFNSKISATKKVEVPEANKSIYGIRYNDIL
jgi:hypothetical protein